MSGDDIAMRATLDTSGVAGGFQQLNGHLNDFGLKTNTATMNLGGLGTVLGTLANPMTAVAAGGMAIGAALASSVNVAGNFQQAMAGVNAIMGGGEAQFKQLSAVAREAGASTQFSATQAAQALGYMAGAGYNAEQSSAALKDVLNLASAGAMDLAQASDLTTSAIAQFGLQAQDAGRVSNVLAAGAAATNTSVSQLGAGLTQVGATANAFGMNIEQTSAALGLLSNGGIKGAEAGTALRGMLAGLAQPSKLAAGALAEIGLTIEEVNPATHEFDAIMVELQEHGMTATQALALFGRENVSAATYTAAHAKELKGLETSITGTDKAAEMAATQTNTYQGAMAELSSAVEEAQISMGNLLLPVLTDSVKVFTEGVRAATDFGKAVSEATGIGQEGGFSAKLSEWSGGLMGLTLEQQAAVAAAQAADAEEAANLSATTYVDEWGNTFDTSDYKSFLVDKSMEAGIEAGTKAGEDSAKAFADSQKAWLDANAAYVEAGYNSYTGRSWTEGQSSTTGYAGLFGRGRTSMVQSDQGIDYEIRANADKFGTKVSLVVDGQVMASGSGYGSRAEALEDLFNKGGFPLSEALSLKFQGRAGDAAKISLQTDLQLENLWDVADSQRSWMKFIDANKDLAANAGDEIIYALYNAEQKAIEANDPTLTESLANVMKGLADPGSVPYQIFNESLADIIDAGYVSEGHREDMKEIAKQDAKSYADALGNSWKDVAGSFKLSDVLASEDMGDWLSKVESPTEFGENVFRPAWLENVKWMLDQVKTGYAGTNEQAVEFIKTWDEFAKKYPFLFTTQQLDTFEKFEKGSVGAKDALLQFSSQTEAAASSVNYLKGQVDNFCSDTASKLSIWTEENKDVMFFGEGEGYVGPTSGYQEWKDGWMKDRGLGESPTEAPIKIGMIAEVDTSQAEQDLKTLRTDQANDPIKINANKDEAPLEKGDQVGRLLPALNRIPIEQRMTTTEVQQLNTNTLNVATQEASWFGALNNQIISSVTSATGNITSTIWSAAYEIIDAIKSSGGGGGGGGGGGFNGTPGVSESGAWGFLGAGGAPSTWKTSPWTSTPSFTAFAEGGYVDKPTLGIFGEAGNEYLVPEKDMQDLIHSLTRNASVSVSMQLDASGSTGQLVSALQNIHVPAIKVPVQIDVDSSALREAAEDAILEAMANLKAKR